MPSPSIEEEMLFVNNELNSIAHKTDSLLFTAQGRGRFIVMGRSVAERLHIVSVLRYRLC